MDEVNNQLKRIIGLLEKIIDNQRCPFDSSGLPLPKIECKHEWAERGSTAPYSQCVKCYAHRNI